MLKQVPQIRLKRHLFIGAIGEKSVGKTTALHFLLEYFFDKGIKSAQAITNWEKPVKIVKQEPSLFLLDNMSNPDQAQLAKDMNSILLRVRRNFLRNPLREGEKIIKGVNIIDPSDHWQQFFSTDLFIYNDEPLRNFELNLQALVELEFPKHPAYVNAIY